MMESHPPLTFGPTTSVVNAFLKQLRHAPQQYPHVTLHQDGKPIQARREALSALAAPAQRHTAVQAAQQAVADILHDLPWPSEATAVKHYVEQIAPQVATVLVLQGYVTPDNLAEDYEQVYVAGWQHVFGEL
jgi:hypothetical protein